MTPVAGARDAPEREAAEAADPLRAPRIRIDMHLHTRASHDCLSDPAAVLERARGRGIDRVCVTDHDTMDAALALAARHPERVVAGEEVRTAEGIDVIGLYLREPIPRGTPAEETCARIREQGGIVYLPHPFARGKGGSGRLLDALLPHIDAIEVFNGRLHPASRNREALYWARGLPLLKGAGSDAHTLGEVGAAYVEVPRHPNEPEAFRRALAHAAVRGRSSPWSVHLASTWAKVRKRIAGA